MAHERAALRAASALAALAAALAAFAVWRWGGTEVVRAEPVRAAEPTAQAGAGPGSGSPGPLAADPAAAAAKGPLAMAAPGSGALQQLGNLAVLSDVAEAAVQSVVNISTTKVVQRQLSDEERMFRRFWGLRGGDRDETRASSLGSGVIVSSDGIVLTNNHVVDGATAITVKLADGRELLAALVGADPRADLAVLRLQGKPEGLKAIPLADSDKVRLGEVVLAIGSPFGLAQSVSMGIVSAKGRADVHIADYEDFIQTDAAINPGNSGGALVNLRGELVGINTAIASSSGGSQGIGFAIPANMVQPIVKSLLESGRVVRGYLGVGIQALTPELRQAFAADAQGGVLVTEVQAGSPAELAGLRRGDVVVELAGKPMDSPRRFRNLVAQAGAGTKLAISVQRQAQRLQLLAELAEAPDPRAAAQVAPQGGLAGKGLQVQPLTPQLARRQGLPANLRGLLVTDVEPQSPAGLSGIQPGDVVLEADRRALAQPSDLQAALKGNRSITLLIWRDGRAAYLALAP
jgi:serine protease Do